jgi:hypothetical protein
MPANCEHCKRRWYKAIQVKPDLDVVGEIQRYQAAGPVQFYLMHGILN